MDSSQILFSKGFHLRFSSFYFSPWFLWLMCSNPNFQLIHVYTSITPKPIFLASSSSFRLIINIVIFRHPHPSITRRPKSQHVQNRTHHLLSKWPSNSCMLIVGQWSQPVRKARRTGLSFFLSLFHSPSPRNTKSLAWYLAHSKCSVKFVNWH